MSASVRLGIIGLGNMGGSHCTQITQGKVPRVEVTAVCDSDQEKLAKWPQIKGFATYQELLASGLVDAVLVATTHYDHTTIGIDAIRAGVHTLIEKPLSVHKADCQRLIAAYEARSRKDLVFAEMFNQRTDPRYIKLRELIRSGELGEICRVNWIITDWFRTEAYYASGGWRATWAGEGGGVLMNQCPHQLDLMQWMFGMPKKVRAFCQLGKWHDIEVEDACTAYLEYANGATGVFISTTGEAPGTNRLEVACDRGRIVIEGDNLKWTRNVTPTSEFLKTSPDAFAMPERWEVTIPTTGKGGQHNQILGNFAEAILDGKVLLGPAIEGINGVELGNAMLMSSLWDRTIELPLDAAAVSAEYQKLIAKSRHTSVAVKTGVGDFSSSFKGMAK
jgi:predicted dehydrogenase